jgi:hypothetical protein
MDVTAVRRAHTHPVGRYPGWWNKLHRLPKRVFKTLSDHDEAGTEFGSSTYRCGGSAG